MQVSPSPPHCPNPPRLTSQPRRLTGRGIKHFLSPIFLISVRGPFQEPGRLPRSSPPRPPDRRSPSLRRPPLPHREDPRGPRPSGAAPSAPRRTPRRLGLGARRPAEAGRLGASAAMDGGRALFPERHVAAAAPPQVQIGGGGGGGGRGRGRGRGRRRGGGGGGGGDV